MKVTLIDRVKSLKFLSPPGCHLLHCYNCIHVPPSLTPLSSPGNSCSTLYFNTFVLSHCYISEILQGEAFGHWLLFFSEYIPGHLCVC